RFAGGVTVPLRARFLLLSLSASGFARLSPAVKGGLRARPAEDLRLRELSTRPACSACRARARRLSARLLRGRAPLPPHRGARSPCAHPLPSTWRRRRHRGTRHCRANRRRRGGAPTGGAARTLSLVRRARTPRPCASGICP